jgi:uncharacterized membrane protein
MALAHPIGRRAASGDDIPVHTIGLHDLRVSLSQGWEDFLAKRGDLVFVGVIYPAAVLLGVIYALRVSLLPMLFPLLAGSVLFGPAVASGFYELARRRERGLDTRWRHFLDVLRSPAAFPLFGLIGINVLLFLFWIITAWLIYVATLGTALPEPVGSVSDLLQAVFSTSEGWRMLVVGNLVGLGFAVLALAISVVSYPMLVDRPVGIGVALRTSLRVARKNPVTVAAWGLIVVALLVLGSLPAFVGLAVVLPVLGYATWHLYTRAVAR